MAAPSTPANAQLTTPGGTGDLAEYPQDDPAVLNRSVLVGYTDVRGFPWWNDPALQDLTQPATYPGAIPLPAVEELFGWEPREEEVFVGRGRSRRQYMDRKGVAMKAITHPVTGRVFSVFTDGYTIHSRRRWFIEKVAALLDTSTSDLGIGSAGELDGGAKHFTQIELPDNVKVAGLEFRPSLLTTGSFDGSMATRNKMVHTVTICGNSFARALAEGGAEVRTKHTRYSDSEARTNGNRDKLGLYFAEASASFAAEIKALSEQDVTAREWASLLDRLVEVPEEIGVARTIAEKKRDQLSTLYAYDMRAAQWSGTALGVVQAFSTWRHTYATVKGVSARYERNYLNAISDDGAKKDTEVREALAMILAKR